MGKLIDHRCNEKQLLRRILNSAVCAFHLHHHLCLTHSHGEVEPRLGSLDIDHDLCQELLCPSFALVNHQLSSPPIIQWSHCLLFKQTEDQLKDIQRRLVPSSFSFKHRKRERETYATMCLQIVMFVDWRTCNVMHHKQCLLTPPVYSCLVWHVGNTCSVGSMHKQHMRQRRKQTWQFSILSQPCSWNRYISVQQLEQPCISISSAAEIAAAYFVQRGALSFGFTSSPAPTTLCVSAAVWFTTFHRRRRRRKESFWFDCHGKSEALVKVTSRGGIWILFPIQPEEMTGSVCRCGQGVFDIQPCKSVDSLLCCNIYM